MFVLLAHRQVHWEHQLLTFLSLETGQILFLFLYSVLLSLFNSFEDSSSQPVPALRYNADIRSSTSVLYPSVRLGWRSFIMFLHSYETSACTFPLSMAVMSGLMYGYNLVLGSLPPAGGACPLLYSMTWTCADLLGKSLAYIYRIFCIINESNLVSPVDYGGRIWGGGILQSRLGGIFLLFCLSLPPSCLPLKLIPPSVLSSKLQSAWNEVRLIGQEPFCEDFFFFLAI